MTKARSAVLMAMALIAAAGCGDDGTDAGSPDTASNGNSDAVSLLGPVDEGSGEPLLVGFIADGQSAAGDNTIDLQVAEATVRYLNEHRAGIAGRPVELVTCETRSDPSRGADCANQMIEKGVPVVGVGATGVYENVWQPLHGAGVPTVFFAGSGEAILGDAESTFSFVSPTASNITLPLSVADQEGVDKVTVVVIDTPAAIVSYENGGEEAFEEAGVDLELVRVPIGTADMTPQLDSVVGGDPGLIHIVGNDTFCISAYQALQVLAFDGPITSIGFCISDATREAMGSFLDGVSVALTAPNDPDDDSTALYRAVTAEYASDDLDRSDMSGINTFVLFAGLDAALEGLDGDVTPESVITAMRSMDETELPSSGGIRFKCDGTAVPTAPAACTSQGLFTVLDSDGQATAIEVTDR
ncbi:MAG TPA: ABC transporter substrate-binding protein [Acidimicrobiales bacterium]|nr:ABC transporter substrate-binding protein [Acidimicrobiales bacterium]